jgi:hypothetical protein
MPRKPDTYERSRLAIYHSIFSRCIGKQYGEDTQFVSFAGLSNAEPKPGDLVRIESAPPSKWSISWFVEMIDKGWNTCLLKSVEDHSVCRWSNIGISVFRSDITKDHPEFLWTDRQFGLWDWWKSIRKKHDSFSVIPMMPTFEDDSVHLQCRIRFGLGEPTTPRRFENWRKLKKKDLYAFFRESVAEFQARPKSETNP